MTADKHRQPGDADKHLQDWRTGSVTTDEATISSGKIADGSVWISSVVGQLQANAESTTSTSYTSTRFHMGIIQFGGVPTGATPKGRYMARFDVDSGETISSIPNVLDASGEDDLSELEIQSDVGGTTYADSGWTELTTIGRGWGPGELRTVKLKVSGGTGEMRNATLITGAEF